jgi:hypothetical protein
MLHTIAAAKILSRQKRQWMFTAYRVNARRQQGSA